MSDQKSNKRDLDDTTGANESCEPTEHQKNQMVSSSGYPSAPPHIVMNQPLWETIPSGVTNFANSTSQPRPVHCPPGLEHLVIAEHLLVRGMHECPGKNRFQVKNARDQPIYYAEENGDCTTKCCWGSMRPLDIKILDTSGKEAMIFRRPLTCDCCCGTCSQRLEVYSPPGNLAGIVEQEWSFCLPRFLVRNSGGETVLRVEGRSFPEISCFTNVSFLIMASNPWRHVGKITKEWTGFSAEGIEDARQYRISFPKDMDVRMKAVLVGTTFLLNSMNFES